MAAPVDQVFPADRNDDANILGRRCAWPVAGAIFVVLFACAGFRHLMFRSGTADQGYFDNWIYLLSQGLPQDGALAGFHAMADHGAWMLHALALLYKLTPGTHWLFAVTAASLSAAALALAMLSRQAGLLPRRTCAILAGFMLYPLVFNQGVGDFHPDVMAVPLLLFAVYFARGGRLLPFAACCVMAVGCKAVLGLTVAAMGVWLMLFERRPLAGAIAVAAGIAGLLFAYLWLIPLHGGSGAERHLYRFGELGGSLAEAIANVSGSPALLLRALFTAENLFYLAMLSGPVAWAFSRPFARPLVAAIPAVGLNLISSEYAQKDVVFWYNLPVLPFLFVGAVAALGAGRGWLTSTRPIVIWSSIWFLLLAKYGYLAVYLWEADRLEEKRQAVAMVPAADSLLTVENLAPHLAHRPVVKVVRPGFDLETGPVFDSILLDTMRDSDDFDVKSLGDLEDRLRGDARYRIVFEREGLVFFRRNS